jgi:hypothetical protein
MTTETDYNGWTNRETWATMLHIDNDQYLYETALDYARTAWQEHTTPQEDEVESWGDVADKQSEARYCLADTLENWITEDLLTLENLAGNQGLFNMLTDIGSLYRVNWNEIANALIDNHMEEMVV